MFLYQNPLKATPNPNSSHKAIKISLLVEPQK